MNPPKKEEKQEDNYNSDNQPKENFTNEQFLRVWKEFTLKVKREKKDSLFSTLVNGEPKFDSNLNIKITVSSNVAAKEVDAIKPEMLKFIRSKLNNFDINLTYNIIKSEKTEFQDSKTKFKKLSSENPSLEKLRKLFNLDIEY
jgi:DNA polymerase-3 subunit gamma/tau